MNNKFFDVDSGFGRNIEKIRRKPRRSEFEGDRPRQKRKPQRGNKRDNW